MSELKEHIFCDIDEVFPRGYCGSLPSHEARPYYLKSEADKVIADKDKEIQRLEKLCESYRIDCDNLAITTDRMRRVGRSLREGLTHQKYKRCLAMAEACMHKRWRLDEEGFDYARSTRQMNKWLELAEKFKEAK